jgi:anaerobic selenocysteine-containing dehydrogenase
MGKLHEILAVEPARRGAYEITLSESERIFANRGDLFRAEVRTYEPFSEQDEKEKGVVDRKDMTTTVAQRLEYLKGFFVDHLDVVFQKETTNQKATGDIVVDGDVLAKDVPVTFLLHLEASLAKLRGVLEKAPTHQAGIHWVPDPSHEFEGVVKNEFPEETFKTKKIIKPFVLVEATKDHPAQVEKLTEDKPVGKFSKALWSGMLSPAQKSELLRRTNKMIEAVRKARMQANEAEVTTEKIGSVIAKAILGG